MSSNSNRAVLIGAILQKAENFSRWAVWAAGTLMLASVVLICFDVLTRKFLNFATNGSNELSGYAFAISTSWALAFGVLQRINVRVDVLYRLLPVRVGAVLDWLSLVLLGVFAGYLTYYASIVAQTSWMQQATANTSLGTPLWIPQFLWVIGMAWMCIVIALMLFRSSVALVTGDMAVVRELCGHRSSLDEAEEETALAEERVAMGDRQ